jgi:nicotinamidase-related amidase
MNSIPVLDRSRACLAIVDLQERLLPAMRDSDRVLQRTLLAAQAAQLLAVPILITEQYRKGLGPTLPALAGVIQSFKPLEKLDFSAWRAPGFHEALRSTGRTQVILAGIECHVCVLQTCLDLLTADFQVFVLSDAVSSRTDENARLGLERMRDSGAVIASTEMVIFEMLQKAGTPEFKAVLGLVK